jgi:hypothetical protein
MKSTAWIAAAMPLECLSWAAALEGRGQGALLLCASLHAGASTCAALGLSARLPQSARSGRWDAAVLFALAFFVPFAGVPGLLLCGVKSLWPAVMRDGGSGMRTLDWPELPARAVMPRAASAQEQSLAAALRHGRDPGVRLRAVLAAGRMRGPAAVALLGEALRDRDDEVRLLAYALLDRTERDIYARIKADEAKRQEARGAARAGLHARLAQHHWELVELGLAQGDVAAHLLAQAGEHVREALALTPGDGNAQVLLGRIELRRGRLDEAEAAFTEALGCGLGEEVIRPYLAEVAFRRRRFDEVRSHVRALGGEERGALEPRVASYWS